MRDANQLRALPVMLASHHLLLALLVVPNAAQHQPLDLYEAVGSTAGQPKTRITSAVALPAASRMRRLCVKRFYSGR